MEVIVELCLDEDAGDGARVIAECVATEGWGDAVEVGFRAADEGAFSRYVGLHIGASMDYFGYFLLAGCCLFLTY